MSEPDDDILLGLFENKTNLKILYGGRGTGKSVLLFQLAEIFNRKGKKVVMAIPNRRRDIDKINFFDIGDTNINIFREDDTNSILDILIKISIRSDYDILLLDDPLPISVLVERAMEWDEARDASFIFALLAELISNGAVILTAHEHNRLPLPRRWKAFIEFDPQFIRIYRKYRIRELYNVHVEDIPRYSEIWSGEFQPTIKQRKMVTLRLKKIRFIVIEE